MRAECTFNRCAHVLSSNNSMGPGPRGVMIVCGGWPALQVRPGSGQLDMPEHLS